ncbi:MAG TPA: AMP-binding protein [Acidimicrobiales bacterium]
MILVVTWMVKSTPDDIEVHTMGKVAGTASTGSVSEVLGRRSERDPDGPLAKCGGDWVTNRQMADAAARIAAGLSELGLGRGHRLAFIAPNRPEVLELLFGVARVGAIQVPLNYFLKGDFLRYQLADSDAQVLVCDAAGYAAAKPLLGETSVKHLVLLDEIDETPPMNAIAFESLQSAEGSGAPDEELSPQDPFAIIYTSGTTGMPKGCVLTHGSYVAGTAAFAEAGWIAPGDRIFTAFPLFHTSGQIIALMNALVVGESVCFEPAFSASTFISRAAEEQATVLQGVGPMAMAILAQPPEATSVEHSLRLASFIPMDPNSQAALSSRLGVPVTAAAYGQTEANPVTMGRLDGPAKPGSAGQASANFDIRLVDDDDREVGTSEIGEICVRPTEPWVMFSGYWNKPDATVEAFRNLWHHTGDFGRLDEDGFLYFVDRKKDALRRRGENISSFELEIAISGHPGIAQAAVVAEPSPLGEDDVRACVVAAPDTTLEAAELFEWFKERLPYFAVPRYVDVLEALPANAMGRVMKHVLREQGVSPDTWDFEAMGLTIGKDKRR